MTSNLPLTIKRPRIRVVLVKQSFIVISFLNYVNRVGDRGGIIQKMKRDDKGKGSKMNGVIYVKPLVLDCVVPNAKVLDIFQERLLQGVHKKTQEQDFCILSFISQDINIVKNWDISQMKGDIHSYVLSTSSFLCEIGKLRYRQSNIGYQIIKIVKYRLIPFS